MKAFRTKTHGKWILTGEHTVLRGGEALVFPLSSKSFQLSYDPQGSTEELEVLLEGNHGPEFKALFRAVLDKALDLKKLNLKDQKGLVQIASQIPAGAGLGASAALCVALTRWMMSEGFVQQNEQIEFARQLENLFHGESSGVDVAVVTAEAPLIFRRGSTPTSLKTLWQPRLAISYSGERGVTYDCVQKVKKLFESNAFLASELDDKMKESVEAAKRALTIENGEKERLQDLKASIDLAKECFESWGLCEGLVGEHMSVLKKAGALAVKPTGSGGGGYVLSLWEGSLPKIHGVELISCFG